MKKRFRPIILALAIFLLIPTSAFASADEPSPNEPIIYEGTNNPVIFGAGEWDTILISDYGLSSSAPTTTRTVLSGGGDLQVCMSGVNSGNVVIAEIRSDDGSTSRQVAVARFAWYESGSSPRLCTGKIDVRPYKDGDYAEIYLVMTSLALDTVTVEIND